MSKNRSLFLLCVAATTLLLAGCNTVKGVGKDVEKAGEVIQGKSAQLAPADAATPVAVVGR